MAQLLDMHGRPLRKSVLRRELAAPTVTGIRSTQRSYDNVGVSPERLALILREAEYSDPVQYLELAEDMEEKDLHYLAVLSTRRRQVSQLTVTVDPADDSAEAEADAELVRGWMKRDEIEDELFDLMDAVGKGFAVCEIIWETSESQWMPLRLEYRLPAWFRYDWQTGTTLQRRADAGTELWVDLEPGKFVVHRARAKSGLPIRGGLARCIMWWWLFKNFGTRDWLRFIEAYGHPLRVGKYGKGATESEKAVLKQAVTSIASDASAIVPEGMMIEFVENTGTGVRADLYKGLLKYVDDSMSKAILGQTLTVEPGESGGGSYALGEVHNEVRQDIEKADAKQLGATLTRDIAVPLVLLNRGPRKLYPRIRIGREARGDPGQLAEALAKLAPLGLRVKAQEIRERLDLAEPGDDDEVLGGVPRLDQGNQDRVNTKALVTLIQAMRSSGTRRQADAIDQAVAQLLAGDGWEPLMDPVIEPVLAEAEAALGRGDSLGEFRASLPALFDRMDDEELVTTLRRMGFSAALSGHAGLTEGE